MANESILHEVEVYLYENFLTPDLTDYSARVETTRSLGLRDVCESSVSRGGADIKAPAMFHAGELIFKEMAYLLCDGFSINFGYFSISLKIRGVFNSPTDTFDPKRHSLMFQMTPGIQLRSELSNIQIKMMGVKKNAAYIALVTDTFTGLEDGTVTKGEDILIQGTRIRVLPDDKSDPQVGIFFIGEDGSSTAVSRRLTQNDPSRVIARVPNILPGSYTLRIVTRYTSNKGVLLKNPLTVDYDRPLIVI
jgi:hypothetical protein